MLKPLKTQAQWGSPKIYFGDTQIQKKHYLLLWQKANGWEVDEWGFLAVSKTYPYPHYHALTDNAIAYGKTMVNRALLEIAKAKKTGEYPLRWGPFSTHELPQWLPESAGIFRWL